MKFNLNPFGVITLYLSLRLRKYESQKSLWYNEENFSRIPYAISVSKAFLLVLIFGALQAQERGFNQKLKQKIVQAYNDDLQKAYLLNKDVSRKDKATYLKKLRAAYELSYKKSPSSSIAKSLYKKCFFKRFDSIEDDAINLDIKRMRIQYKKIAATYQTHYDRFYKTFQTRLQDICGELPDYECKEKNALKILDSIPYDKKTLSYTVEGFKKVYAKKRQKKRNGGFDSKEFRKTQTILKNATDFDFANMMLDNEVLKKKVYFCIDFASFATQDTISFMEKAKN